MAAPSRESLRPRRKAVEEEKKEEEEEEEDMEEEEEENVAEIHWSRQRRRQGAHEEKEADYQRHHHRRKNRSTAATAVVDTTAAAAATAAATAAAATAAAAAATAASYGPMWRVDEMGRGWRTTASGKRLVLDQRGREWRLPDKQPGVAYRREDGLGSGGSGGGRGSPAPCSDQIWMLDLADGSEWLVDDRWRRWCVDEKDGSLRMRDPLRIGVLTIIDAQGRCMDYNCLSSLSFVTSLSFVPTLSFVPASFKKIIQPRASPPSQAVLDTTPTAPSALPTLGFAVIAA